MKHHKKLEQAWAMLETTNTSKEWGIVKQVMKEALDQAYEAGYLSAKRYKTKELKAYKKAAEDWMKEYDKLKDKHEPAVSILSQPTEPTATKSYLILAGTKEEALNYLYTLLDFVQSLGISYKFIKSNLTLDIYDHRSGIHTRYFTAFDAKRLLGLQIDAYTTIGTFYEQPNSKELTDIADIAKVRYNEPN